MFMIYSSLVLIFSIIQNINANKSCQTPLGKAGICININQCTPLVKKLKQDQPLSESSLRLLKSLHCGYEGHDPKICCENELITLTSGTIERAKSQSKELVMVFDLPTVNDHGNLRLLNDELCGGIIDTKIVGGNKTRIREFRWMALVAYKTGRLNYDFRCGGTIINKRYILTAAHCLTDLPTGITVTGVRVGDHDISRERDCERDENGLEIECAEKYQDFGIESSHYHFQYSRRKLQNDIGLIRLDNDINFQLSNVRPICLPIHRDLKIIQKKVTVTGWGITENGTRSDVLLKVKLSPISNEECAKLYKNFTEIGYKQMCAGGESEIDSCSGDSGGPLQSIVSYEGEPRWMQFGIVSFGLRNCGTEGIPGVYTRVDYYIDWILNIMNR